MGHNGNQQVRVMLVTLGKRARAGQSGYTRPPETGVLSLLLPHIPAFPGAHELSVSRHSSVGKD